MLDSIINISRLSPLFASIITVLIGSYVFFYDKKRKDHQLFFLYCLLLSLWALGCFFQSVTTNSSHALFIDRLLYSVAVFFPLMLLLVANIFIKKRFKFISYILFFFGCILFLSNWLFRFRTGVNLNFGARFVTTPDLGWYIYLLFFSLIFIWVMYLFINEYKNSNKKDTFLLLIISMIILLFSGNSYYILILFKINPLIDSLFNLNSSVLLSVYSLLSSYLIVKDELLNSKFEVHKSLAVVVASILVSFIFVSLIFTFKSSILVQTILVTTFGILSTIYGRTFVLKIQTYAEQKFLKGKYDFKKALRIFQEHLNNSTSIEDISKSLATDFRNEIEMGPVGLFLPQHFHITYDISDTFVSYSPEHLDTVFNHQDSLLQLLNEKKDVLTNDSNQSLQSHFSNTLVAAVIPFFKAETLLGFIVLGPKFSEDRLTGEDIDFFRTISQQIPAVLDRIAQTKVAAEVDVAKRIQLDILPETPLYSGLDIAAFMEAADEVGGDYYDMIVKDDMLWVLMGDVTGHGLASGLVMFMAQSILTSILQTRIGVTPAELNFLANNILCQNMGRLDEERPLTLASFCFSDNGRKVTLSGSHDNALIYRANSNTIERLFLDDFPMGIGFTDVLEQADFLEQKLEFHTGDIILMLSDGITEAVKEGNLDGETMGEAPLEEILLSHHAEPAEKIRDRVIYAVKSYTQNIFYDDVTLVVVRVVGL